jgi:hypothetical protein
MSTAKSYRYAVEIHHDLPALALRAITQFPQETMRTGHSFASRPVPKTITGCVVNGSLHSSNGYEIRVRNMDLVRYEGKRIKVSGNLLPGDNFHADKDSLKLLGECGENRR